MKRTLVLVGMVVLLTACSSEDVSTPSMDTGNSTNDTGGLVDTMEPMEAGTDAAVGVEPVEDAGLEPDAGTDAGTIPDAEADAGAEPVEDAGPVDTGPIDAGSFDGGTPDAGCGPCGTPPSDYCQNNAQFIYDATGSCDGSGTCQYTATKTNCGYGCLNGACRTNWFTTKSVECMYCANTKYCEDGLTCRSGLYSFDTTFTACGTTTTACANADLTYPSYGQQGDECLGAGYCDKMSCIPNGYVGDRPQCAKKCTTKADCAFDPYSLGCVYYTGGDSFCLSSMIVPM